MFEQLSTFDKVSVVAWILIVVLFTPRVYRNWKGRREDWIEAGWLAGGVVMVAVSLLKPEWRTDASSVVLFPLAVLTLLERTTRKK